jgi:hypothetical protein
MQQDERSRPSNFQTKDTYILSRTTSYSWLGALQDFEKARQEAVEEFSLIEVALIHIDRVSQLCSYSDLNADIWGQHHTQTLVF